MGDFMRKLLILFIILFLSACKVSNSSKEDSESIFMNLGLLGIRSNKLTISGTAVKGILKNAIVTVNPLNLDGSCNSETVLATENTNADTGSYSLVYNKTGSIVCITVTPNPNGQTKMFDEKLNSDITLPGNSSFKLVTILPESKIINNNRKNTLISPFSKMLGRRFQNLIRQAGENADKNALHRKASKEIVIRFGLSSGLSVASSSSMYSTRAGGISDTMYPELDDILVELENPASPLSAKFTSILVGLSQLANTYKNGASLSIDDIDAIIEAFASDFEDGVFDGKTSTGASITIGPVGNQVTFSSTPLTTTLLPAITTYIQNGGSLSLGLPTSTPPPTITTTEITNQTQFVDNAVITSPSLGTAPTITYAGSPYTLTANVAISPITPVATGTITSCAADITLPVGLALSSNCEITGTPTATQASTNYTITATNSAGTGTTVISITVNLAPPSALTYTGSPYIFLQNTGISPLTPTFTGTVTSCSASPTLPTGLTINNTTCVISGTPTGTQAATGYTITASNAFGNTTANINIAVNPPPPSGLSYPLRSLPFILGVSIGTVSPSVTGSVTSYSISPSLPAGLTINTSTGIISGTPSGTIGATNYTVTASNASGSTNANVTFSVVTNHPFTYLFFKGSQDGDITGAGGGASICSNYANTNLPFLRCNGFRAFISQSGDDIVNAPTTNSFSGTRPVYGVNASTQATTQLATSWANLWSLGSTPLLATFSTAMNFATGYYFTFSNSNGTYDATNNCTNGTTNNSGIDGTTGRSDQVGTAAITNAAFPCYAYTLICVCY